MKRDGIAFIGIMGFSALLAGQGAMLLSGFGTLFAGYYALKLVFKTMANIPAVKEREEEFNTTGYELSVSSLPYEMNLLKQFFMTIYYKNGDQFADTVSRFLTAVNVNGVNQHLPDYLYDGIVLKLMWEYHKKYGSLSFTNGSTNSITEAEALKPLSVVEEPDFHRFCLKHTR